MLTHVPRASVLCVPGSCVLYVPEAQGSVHRGWDYCM